MEEAETLEAAVNSLMNVAGKMAEELYSQGQPAAEDTGDDDNVVDAEFTDASENEA